MSDITYFVRHRFLPYSLLNHTDKPTQWLGTRYANEDEAIKEARKSAEFSTRDGIQVEVVKEVVVWKFANHDYVGKWGRPENNLPEETEIEEFPELEVLEPEEPPTLEELVWRLFTEKKKTRKEIAVIVALSYDNVCKIIRAERRHRGSVGINADAR